MAIYRTSTALDVLVLLLSYNLSILTTKLRSEPAIVNIPLSIDQWTARARTASSLEVVYPQISNTIPSLIKLTTSP